MSVRALKILIHRFLNILHDRVRGYSDFYSFPFDVSTPLNEYAEQVLNEGCSILESLNIPYYVCDGTILGIVRDNKLIPHDNDIDVAVNCDCDADNLIAAFAQKGYKVGRKVFYKGKLQQLIFYSVNYVIYDICVWQAAADGYCYHYVPEVPKGRRQSAIFFGTPEYVTFRNRRYPTHPGIREWLREHYGEDWHIPKFTKGDWRLDVKDIVK